MYLKEICDMLDTYTGRDKVMRTLCYSMKFASGVMAANNPGLSSNLQIFSSQMSATRATLRLFDDLPMLQYTLQYGLGKQEPDRCISVIGVLTNMIDHFYYPVEKVCWLAEHRMLILKDPGKWDTISSLCWVISIYLTLMKTFRSIMLLQNHKKCLHRMDGDAGFALANLLMRQRMEYLTAVRLSLDLVHSISTLPNGWLWGSKLVSWKVGLIGTISSILGLYQYFAKKHIPK